MKGLKSISKLLMQHHNCFFRNMKKNKRSKQILIQTLSNIYDWDSDDLKKDFIDFMILEQSNIYNADELEKIFDTFDQLNPLEKDQILLFFNDFLVKALNHSN